MTLDDKEIAAMCELYRILAPFDRNAQERMVSYATHRLFIERSLREQDEYAAAQKAQLLPPNWHWPTSVQGRPS